MLHAVAAFVPTSRAPPPPRGSAYCLPPNVTGVSASVNGKFYKLYGTNTYEASVVACNGRDGQLPKWESHAEQYAVEQILFGSSSNVIMYWLGARAIMTDTKVFRYTNPGTGWGTDRFYQSGDKWDRASLTRTPWPQDTSPYSHWGEDEPSTWGVFAEANYAAGCSAGTNFNIDNRCILAVESLKYATVGANYSRVVNDSYGNAWGWTRADCDSTAFFICDEQSEHAAPWPQCLAPSGAHCEVCCCSCCCMASVHNDLGCLWPWSRPYMMDAHAQEWLVHLYSHTPWWPSHAVARVPCL